jgi:hypothetical protein
VRNPKGSKSYTTVVLGASRVYAASTPISNVFDSTALRNTFKTNMLVDEIRFFVYPHGNITTGNISGYASRSFLDKFAVQFSSRNRIFSAAPVNINLLCTNFQTDLEQQVEATNRAQYQEDFQRWIPPEPIWLAEGDTLLARVVETTSIATDAVAGFDLWIVYVGRITDEKPPPSTRVPYILQYIQPPGSPIGPSAPTQFVVPSLNLQNPLNRPLRLQRIIARLEIIAAAPTTDEKTMQGRDILRDVPDFCQIQVTDDQQFYITGDVNMGALVDMQRSAWTFVRDIGPQGYLNVRFTRQAITGYENMGLLPEICLICDREEEF